MGTYLARQLLTQTTFYFTLSQSYYIWRQLGFIGGLSITDPSYYVKPLAARDFSPI